MDPCGCEDFASIFDRRRAEQDVERYRRKGPDRSTRLLLDLLEREGIGDATVLDVGAGIGIVDRRLLAAGAKRAVLSDASSAALTVAAAEAERAGMADRIELVPGDFVRRAPEIEPADVVVLDRVVCCYGDVDGLVGLSAARARRVYGLVLPRDRLLIRTGIAVMRTVFRLVRNPYRPYAHPNARVDALVAAQGLRPVAEARTAIWRVVVYRRDAAAA